MRMWTKMWTTCRRLRKLSIIINYLSHFNGGANGTGGERSLRCSALIYNNAVFLNVLTTVFGGKHQAEPVPPKPHRLVADIDATFMQQILDVAKGKWKPNVHHYRSADDLGGRLEVAKRGAFCHGRTLNPRPARL